MNTALVSSANNFAHIARGFCSWCEGLSLGDEPEALAAAWLSKLYAAAIELPDVGPDNSDGLPDIPYEQLEQSKRNLAHFNGMYYREYFDPNPLLEDEACMGDVGDDLLDTYKDIRSGLRLFEQGQLADALWYWSFLHRVHWGRHAVGAIFALHCLYVSNRA